MSDHSNISIECRAYGGANIRRVIEDMLALANRIGVSVLCTCNDVRTLARPGDNAERIWKAWQEASESSSRKFASDPGEPAT